MGILDALVSAGTNVVKAGVDAVTPSTGTKDTATIKTTDGKTVTVEVKK